MRTLAKARILVTRFPYESRFGGEEVHTLTLMEELRKDGFELFFSGSCPVLLREFDDREFEIQKTWLGKPPVTKFWLLLFTLMSPFLFLKAGQILKSSRKLWNVDTLYCLSLGEKLLMTPWALRAGMKVIWLEHARIGNWLTKNPWRILYSRLSRKVDVIVTSHAMKKFLPFAHNVRSITCAAIVEKPVALPQEIYDFLHAGFCVATVARLTVDKGVDMIDKLVHSEPDCRAIVVGSGPLKLHESERLKVVSKLTRGQLTELYKNVDLFILPSRDFDPFGMVAAEAMMCKTPVLVTNQCGIAFDLHNEHEAMIVPAKFNDIHKAVKKLKSHPELRKKIADCGQKFAQKNYTLERMVGEFEELLRKN